MVEQITEFFIDGIESPFSSPEMIILFYKTMFFSERMVRYIDENDYIGIFIEQYEKVITQLIKDNENSDRQQTKQEALKSYFYGGSDY